MTTKTRSLYEMGRQFARDTWRHGAPLKRGNARFDQGAADEYARLTAPHESSMTARNRALGAYLNPHMQATKDDAEGIALPADPYALSLAGRLRLTDIDAIITGEPRAANAATFNAVAIEVYCHKCGDPLPNPRDGSHMWTRLDFGGEIEAKCQCGAVSSVRLPLLVEFD